MSDKTLYMETTEISAEKTAHEISKLMLDFKVRGIRYRYDPQERLDGLEFELFVQGIRLSFSLPVRTEPIFKILQERRRKRNRYGYQQFAKQDREKADRVAWRQLLRWMQAQFALIEVGMVKAEEVFLPYMLRSGTRQTLFEHFQANELKRLEAGKANA